MSKIKIFALGGLNEDGKNMYVIDVDNDVFIFDAGLKYPRDRMLGIDYIIPSIDYLKENYKRIKGIFITHGHESNMGALSDIVMDLPEIPIFGSKFTIEIIKLQLNNDNIKKANLHVIKPHLKLNFGNNSIFPISVTHSIPDCFCYVLNTSDGAIVYTGDFIFDPGQTGMYGTDIGKLAYIGKQGVLCLMSESLYAAKRGFTSPNHKVNKYIRTVLHDNPNRIIMSILPAHLMRIQEIFDEVSKTKRRIVIMGKALQDMINMAIKEKYLFIDPSKIGDLTNLNDKGIIVLISDGKEKPYMNLERIIRGTDKYIKAVDTDTIFITEPMYLGVEKRMVQIMDDIAKANMNVISLNGKVHLLEHPSREDLMLMINLMQPKYYFPVKGEYKDQYANADIANQTGIDKDNIILKLNGDVATFVDGELQQDEFDKVKVDDVLIDGKSQNDIGELVLKDREMLAENGIVIVCATLNRESKEIIAGPEVLTRGFIYVKDNMDVLAESQKISEEVIKRNTAPGTKVDYNQIKQEIRDELGRYFYTETECRPIIITVMQEV
jgi:ribonuclease J